MKKALFLIVLICWCSTSIFAQEVCESPDEVELDVNSITKCTIKDSKDKKNNKSRQISVKVSANRRFLKKRESLKKQKASNLGVKGIARIEKNTETSSVGKIKLSTSLKSKIENVKKKLSAEELRKASKFSTVDKIPLFSSCKKAKKGERIDCFNEQMINHISKHFRYPSDAIKESIQGEVWVRFIIDKNGDVKNIKTLGPKNGGILNQEAVRVVSKLPQFAPAKKNGSRVSVKYGFPIAFALEE